MTMMDMENRRWSLAEAIRGLLVFSLAQSRQDCQFLQIFFEEPLEIDSQARIDSTLLYYYEQFYQIVCGARHVNRPTLVQIRFLGPANLDSI